MRFPRFRRRISKRIGHSFSAISVTIFRLKTSSLNTAIGASLTSRRCRQVFGPVETIDEKKR